MQFATYTTGDGMCNIERNEVKNISVLYKLWRYECMRTISDRFITQTERDWFQNNLEVNAKRELGDKVYSSLNLNEGIFVDFLREPPEPVGDEEIVIPKVYELVPSLDFLSETLQRYQKQYNNATKGLPMDLVFFKDFMYHLIIISRIIRTPKGNALLVGVGGSGKQSVTRLATFIANYEMKQLVLTRSYNVSNLMDDIKILYRIAGHQGKGVTFIFTDNDIKDETFLEPINNILSSGEVANLFAKDELDEILVQMVAPMKKVDSKRPATQDNLYDFFISQAKNNLHVTLCFSPVGEKFRSRALMFPGLVSGCTIDWYYKWPPDALAAVSNHFLSNYPITGTPQVIASLMHMMGQVHTIVSAALEEYFLKFRRRSFVTPKSFLTFLDSYKDQYGVRLRKIDEDAFQRKIGLLKLDEAAVSVEELRKELVFKEKNIAVATAAANVILKSVSIKAEAAEKVKAEVEVVKAKAQELVDVIAADKKVAEGKLKAAEPALAAAEAALATIKPADIQTVKALKTPPYLIQVIMDCVIILFKEKMIPAEHKTDVDPPFLMPSWGEATKQLNNIQFLANLFKFNKDAINDETIDLMEPYLSYRNYTKEAAQSSCGQVAGLLSWTIAMNDFYKVNKEVLPLKANLAIQQIKLDIALAEKEKAEAILAAKNKEVAAARAQLDTADKALKEVTAEGNACKTKMNAASDLITGLAGEKIRWTEQALEFKKQAVQLIGDVLILCGFLGYAGPFNQEYRTKLKERWYVALQERGIPCTKNLNVTESLVDQPTISEWNLQGLPTDDLSTQNGIIVTQASRYPLLIDPQGQGITWIKKREEPFDLRITSLNSRYFRQNLEDALVEGKPLLIAEILEELDPVLDNVLEKNFIKQGSKYKLRLGDKDLEVQPFLFRLYITTNLANPSYTPEVSARCSIIDFTVTLKGLEEQLLARVILRERRELEDERLALIKDVTLNKRKTIELEQNLLLKLTTVKGSLVDDESVLRTLNVTKDTAIQVRRKIQIAFETEKAINLAREGFRPVANRGSILYFLICDMSLVNYMYQTSLLQFLERFNISMERSDKSDRVVERIAYIIEFLTDDVFRYKVRGLYEEHKYMFPLLLTLRIDMDRKAITFAEFNYLLKGGAALDLGLCPPKPASWITDISWLNICELNKLPPFTDLIEQVKFNEQSWKVWYGKPAPEEEFIPNYDKVKLKSFHRLLIVRAWCPDRTLMESKKYITQSLGPQFADPILFNMEAMVIESKPSTPLINFLSMGSDPTVEIETLARKLKVACQSISMGQAQEIHARKLIDAFVTEGGWALLQNCHLGLEYMTELFGYMQNVEKFHPDFRVWITTEPHLSFPMSLLQISIKFTSQPPAGLRAGLKRTYSTMSQNMFSYSQREEYTYLLFTTSFLHTVVQERRKFGPLGWNIPYEFNYADWYASCLFMQNHCDSLSKKEFVSWVTIRYMIAEVQYGGRVTDDYDKRLLNTFATVWFANDVYSNLDFQFYPGYPLMRFRENMQRYLDAIDLLPQNDPPPVYCLHPNADITYQTNTTNAMLNTVIEIQPKESAGDGEAESREVVVARLAQDMISKLPPLYEAHVCRDRYKAMGATKPLVTVLRQEIDRMQKVIRTVSVTLKDLLLAVDGIIIMNENLKDSLDNIFDARVPTAWKRGSWASSSLGFWFTELLERNEQLSNWLYNGRPEQFWMTGFFNPQGFLTAMKQEVARANRWELDVVNLTNKILGFYREGIKGGPNEGVFVYGLFLEGATWDRKRDILVESQPKILSTLLPVFHINATNKPYAVDPKLYTSPVYKKPGRTGLNFITKLWIPCEHEMETHWILRAVALLCDTK